jgi:uncharacterized membrane protein YccC
MLSNSKSAGREQTRHVVETPYEETRQPLAENNLPQPCLKHSRTLRNTTLRIIQQFQSIEGANHCQQKIDALRKPASKHDMQKSFSTSQVTQMTL